VALLYPCAGNCRDYWVVLANLPRHTILSTLKMTELLDVQLDNDHYVVTFRDADGTFDVSLSAQGAAVLIAALAQAVVNRAEPNRPATAWLQWPTMAQTSEVSFDIDSLGAGVVGMAIKLPGLMPIKVEIPPDSAHQVAFALSEAANKSQIPEIGKN